MEFCPHCMQPAAGEVCGRCGGSVNWTAAPGQLPLGTLLRGAEGHTYQIGAARGQGGFGITYAAMDLTTAQRVAIKEYYPTRCALRTQLNQVMPMTGQNEVYRGGMNSFLEEAMMLSAVGALPSVVTVKDYFEANGTAYLVMEFVDGVALHQIVSKQGKMSAGELLPKLPELLMDLDTLHRAGIIHRDISPDNLILMPDGKLKLLDFGSARSVQDGKSMTILLKAGFSPVEQYQSRGQGAWTDVYALAGTIYYCLTGVIPPSAVDRLDEDTLQKPNTLGAGLTAEQEEALVWGLVVQPKSRPASMEIFRQRLFPGQVTSGIAGERHDVPPSNPAADPLSKLKDTVDSTVTAAKDILANAKDAVSVATENFVNKINQSAEKVTQTTETQTTVPDEKTPETPVTAPETPEADLRSAETNASAPKSDKKKKLLKRVLIGLGGLAAAALLVFFVFYIATHGTTDDGFVYRLDIFNDCATITGYKGDGGVVVIPEEIRDLNVEYLEDRAFERQTKITSITIPTKVYPFSRVFFGCSGITLVIFDGEDRGFPWSGWDDELGDCKNLQCVFFTNAGLYETCIEKEKLAELDNVVLCHKGQDTGFGLIKSVEVIDNIVYALTDTKYAVILQMPDALDGDSLSPTLGAFTVILPDGRTPGQVDPIEGVTSDGYSYYISADRSECVITGYTGNETVLDIPDEIEGYPVNIIGEDAFAGNTAIESVFFPIELDKILDNAFKNCVKLKDIYLYSQLTYANTSFAGCDALRCAVLETDTAAIDTVLHLPSDFMVYRDGMDTGVGKLDYVGVSNMGVIYGVTKDKNAVVLDIPDNITEIEILASAYDYPVKWIYEKALDGVSSSAIIHLPTETLFPYELWNAADWEFLDSDSAYTLAECWWYSCCLCAMIREERGGNPVMYVDEAATRAAMQRAEEMSEVFDFVRPNGDSWGSVLNEFGVKWSYASTWQWSFANDNVGSNLQKAFDWVTEAYAPPEDDHNNEYYTRIGIGMYYDSEADKIFISCIATMVD